MSAHHPPRRPPDEELIAAWHSTMNMAEIARSFGCEGHQVYVWWHRLRAAGRIPTSNRPTTYRRSTRAAAAAAVQTPKPAYVPITKGMLDGDDGRPRVSTGGDPLLDRLLAVHGAPRYDIPQELKRHGCTP